MSGLPKELPRLTSLRAFAALGVFLYHGDGHKVITGPLDRIVGLGYLGVSFFFVLSGFVLTWSTPPTMPAARFLRNRFARIYPATFVSMVAAFVVPVTDFGLRPAGVILGFLLLQAWIPVNTIVYGANGLTWTLSCETFFYLSLLFVLGYLRHLPSRRQILIAGAYLVSAAVIVGAISNRDDTLQAVALCNPLIRSAEFLLGVVAALLVRSGWRLSNRAFAVIVVLGTGIAAASEHFTQLYPMTNEIMAPFFAAVIVMAAQRDFGHRPGILASRTLIYAGQVSFCFYLVHELVLTNFVHKLGRHGALTVDEALAVAIGAAIVLHHAVELPFQKLIRGRKSAAQSIALHPEAALSSVADR